MNSENTPQYLYRIVSIADWQKSLVQSYVEPSQMDKEFIHLSTLEQLPNVAQKYWSDQQYMILKLDSKKLIGRLLYERNPGGVACYYHLYDGQIPLNAVVSVSTVYAA